jgi:hypothetical protein
VAGEPQRRGFRPLQDVARLPPAEKLQRLVDLGIELAPVVEFPRHFVFTRGGYVALVERRGDSFGAIGAPGLYTDHGTLAMLVWRREEAWLVAKGWERRAKASEVEGMRRFGEDLARALAD